MNAARREGSFLGDSPQLVVPAIREWLGGRPLLLATDFDGTLSELAPTPSTAAMSAPVTAALQRVAAHPRITLAVVSGRRLDDVHARTGRIAPFVGGLHGLEISGPTGGFMHPSLLRVAPIIADIRDRATTLLSWCPDVVIEDKTYALTCHVRLVPGEAAGRVLGQFLEIAQPALDQDLLRALPGAQALELLPAVEWHKGKAIEWIRSVVDIGPTSGVGVVYLGDDRTDEDAFATLRERGFSIGVGERPHAHLIRCRLDGPRAVGELLDGLAHGLA